MVSASADDTVRILDGMNIISKFKKPSTFKISSIEHFHGDIIVATYQDRGIEILNLTDRKTISSIKTSEKFLKLSKLNLTHFLVATENNIYTFTYPDLVQKSKFAINNKLVKYKTKYFK